VAADAKNVKTGKHNRKFVFNHPLMLQELLFRSSKCGFCCKNACNISNGDINQFCMRALHNLFQVRLQALRQNRDWQGYSTGSHPNAHPL
jgi:hypothetical protein